MARNPYSEIYNSGPANLYGSSPYGTQLQGRESPPRPDSNVYQAALQYQAMLRQQEMQKYMDEYMRLTRPQPRQAKMYMLAGY